MWGAGVMLRQLAEDSELSSVSHVFIDEVEPALTGGTAEGVGCTQVHERSMESDFLLAAVKVRRVAI